MKIESVCVIGAGTIGSLCAGHLSRVAEVSVITRRAEQALALRRAGLTISGKSTLHADLLAATGPADVPPADLVVVATKGTQVEGVAASLEGCFPNAVVMTIQNGLGAEEALARHGDWPLVSSVTFMSGTRQSDTHVHYELDTATWMGPFHPSGILLEIVETVGGLFTASGLEVKVMPDVRPAQWSKLIFNASVSSVAAVTDLPHVNLFERREEPADLGHLVFDLIAEGKAVAAASGVELLEDPWDMNVQAIQRGSTHDDAYAHVPSMLVDIRSGHRTEIDTILGPVVSAGRRLGVPVPLSEALYRLVKARDRWWEAEE